MQKYFLLSYPKSGRTWLRLIINKYMLTKYNNLNENLLSANKNLSKISHLCDLIHTHGGFSWEKDVMNFQDLVFNKTILLTRDIKDTLVSSFFHNKHRRGQLNFNGDISDFLKSKYGVKHIKSFYERIKNIEFAYTLDYKDLHYNPFESTKKILTLLGESVTDEILIGSIKYCRFNNLQKKELSNEISLSDKQSMTNKNGLKVREGKIGNYINYLSQKDIEYIEKEFNL